MNTRRPSGPQPRRRPAASTRPVSTRNGGRAGAHGRWLPAIAAGAVLLVVVAAGVSGSGEGGASNDSSAAASLDGSGVSIEPSVPPETLPSIGTESTEGPVVKTSFAQPIAKGSFGPDVKQLQQRLTDLGFSPGTVDGQFGSLTQQAVWAYKKLVAGFTFQELNSSNNKTVVTNELWQQMQEPLVIQPRRPQQTPGRTHVEIYLPLQVLAVFADDQAVFIAHISTGLLDDVGQPKEFCETVALDTDENGEPLDPPVTKDICALAKTPGGIFKFTRRYEGKRVGPLGGMLNPVYFNYGIAIHGAENVPTAPASHGCIRIHNQLAEVFPGLVAKGDRVFVWGHDGKEPEYYSRSESLPSFNRPDPNATTTTSGTTTTAPVVDPEPTVKSPTTTAKPSPTTTKPPATTVPVTTVPATVPTTIEPISTDPP